MFLRRIRDIVLFGDLAMKQRPGFWKEFKIFWKWKVGSIIILLFLLMLIGRIKNWW